MFWCKELERKMSVLKMKTRTISSDIWNLKIDKCWRYKELGGGINVCHDSYLMSLRYR